MGICFSTSHTFYDDNDYNKSKGKDKNSLQKIKKDRSSLSMSNQRPSTLRNRGSLSKSQISGLNKNDFKINSELIVNQNKSSPKDNYIELEVLGVGAYGKVTKVRQKKTKLIRAMKKISKNLKSNKETVNEIINEIELLKHLDHPNIVKLFEFFVELDGYYLITEYCPGGQLLDLIQKRGRLPEPVAANIMYQIFNAVNYCHQTNKIIHRDLKLENILIVDEIDGFYTVKIIDFGTAKICEQNKNENKVIGSSYYIAPEVLMKDYNEKCDIWSCGVVLYILLSGRPPFSGGSDTEVIHKIKEGRYDLKRPPFDKISDDGKGLIKKCLDMNSKRRLSAAEAIRHSWFLNLKTKDYFCKVSDEFLQKTIENIRKFKPTNKLQILAITYLVHNLPDLDELKYLNRIFNLFDINSNGKLTINEIDQGLKKHLFHNNLGNLDMNLIDKYTKEVFSNLDTDNNGYIEYEEFARAGLDKEIFKDSRVLKFSFNYLDKDRSGEISVEELKEVFKIQDIQSEILIKDIIRSMDQDLNGQISFKEYKDMMMKIIY